MKYVGMHIIFEVPTYFSFILELERNTRFRPGLK